MHATPLTRKRTPALSPFGETALGVKQIIHMANPLPGVVKMKPDAVLWSTKMTNPFLHAGTFCKFLGYCARFAPLNLTCTIHPGVLGDNGPPYSSNCGLESLPTKGSVGFMELELECSRETGIAF